ncbi:MAG: carboxypeptidase-like regulatory domain-containing protein [Bacteroidia bacterium]|nr:carboxypeptidase-like regulatory domain-containing protein [Bacteroidia bacterium]
MTSNSGFKKIFSYTFHPGKFFIFSVLFFVFHSAFSQTKEISGTVTDEETKEPLAFVNIIYNERNQATATNIDGKFKITATANAAFLKFSYVGYESKTIKTEDIRWGKPLAVKLKKAVVNLNEVTVFPGENPAHRIIKKVIENRDINNPEKMTSFAYTSYNKMFFTFNIDDLKKTDSTISFTDSIQVLKDTVKSKLDTIRKTKVDSSYIRAKKFIDSQHIFLMESVSDRKFIYPDKNNEKVVATRVSGLRNPSFALLATQMQSFSFYKELITIYDKIYLNPISEGSTKKYFFLLEDTTFSENGDTVFIVSFRPFKGKNFDGLKGILNISSNKYAIQSVKAEPYDPNPVLGVKIQQKYEFLENKQWFPVQLNTDLTFNNMMGQVGKKTMRLIGIGKSYLRNITLNPELNKKEFKNIEVTMGDDAYKLSDEFWEKYRVDSLTAKDRKTYRVIDSIGKKENLDLKMKVFEALAQGYIPWHFLNIDFSKLVTFNEYEGFRFGLALMTNEKITRFVSVGGFFAASTKDKAMKYGGKVEFSIYPEWELKLKTEWCFDVYESDGYSFLEEKNYLASDMYRQFLISEMDSVEKKEVSISFRALQYLKLNFSLSRNHKIITDNFRYGVSENRTDLLKNYNYTETGINLKFAYNEKFMKFPNGKFSLGTDYPILWANFTRAVEWLDGEYDYTKIEAKISKSFITKTFGKTYLQLSGGMVSGNVPYSGYYNGHGSYEVFSLDAANSFGTMRMNEFVADRFAAFYFKQDFGSLLFKTKKFKPQLAIVNNIGYGDFVSSNHYFDKPVNTYNKGYFESGILFNNLLHQMFIGYGVGVFYRYGTYAFHREEDNFAVKLSITFDL